EQPEGERKLRRAHRSDRRRIEIHDLRSRQLESHLGSGSGQQLPDERGGVGHPRARRADRTGDGQRPGVAGPTRGRRAKGPGGWRQMAQEDRVTFARLATVVVSYRDRLGGDFDKAFAANDTLAPKLERSRKSTSAAVAKFIDVLNRELVAGTALFSTAEYFEE